MVPVTDQGKLYRSNSKSHGSASNLEILDHGEKDTLEYRIRAVEKEGLVAGKKQISLWHDVSLVHVDPVSNRPTPYLNFVCEIPKFSRCVELWYFVWIRMSLSSVVAKQGVSLYCFYFLCIRINRKKYEIATDEVGNPIKQDEKKGQLREVSHIFCGSSSKMSDC